jgi:transcription antitermination factor NusA-like protein
MQLIEDQALRPGDLDRVEPGAAGRGRGERDRRPETAPRDLQAAIGAVGQNQRLAALRACEGAVEGLARG